LSFEIFTEHLNYSSGI